MIKKFLKEFKEFGIKGDILGIAIGVIIGNAFGKIVNSLVEDIIMPIIAFFTGSIDYSNLYYAFGNENITEGMTLADAKAAGAVLAYGNFITIIIDFFIVTFSIFIAFKVMIAVGKKLKKEEKKEEKVAGPTQEQLLTEIRDLLKKQAK